MKSKHYNVEYATAPSLTLAALVGLGLFFEPKSSPSPFGTAGGAGPDRIKQKKLIL